MTSFSNDDTGTEQAKIERVLRLISLLKERRRTVPQLARAVNTSPRSMYRYLKLLDKIGYHLENDEQNRYWIFEGESTTITFTVEETAILRPSLSGLKASSPLYASIERKIYLTSELVPLAAELLDRHRAQIVTQLNEAIKAKRQVRLLRYHSSNSNSTTDRLVEPLSFTDDFSTLNAYEPQSQKTKTFKVSRIEDLEVLAGLQENDLPNPEIDIFGWTGPEPIFVELHLTPTAYQLLIEEHPAARPYLERIKAVPYSYLLSIEVRSFVGIGRFILGLHQNIAVVQPQELKDYLNEIVAGMGY
ncbi:helix-turn-helix transcriptional regulator [Runella aurantiaca]|uniref:WYL domain-containing protein n=1 Tax=Runella aurantiaca TaxID=2282308 RepID=A0A369I701_9BACT|nr:WYL domain-containing protein [Runella aurantiaca]RDB02446.1 WYL domain-containing protein [Runella aurantiaca]